MKKCDLDEDINQCQYFDKKNKKCINPEKCSFQLDDGDEVIVHHPYMREERWYEKYQKGTRRIR